MQKGVGLDCIFRLGQGIVSIFTNISEELVSPIVFQDNISFHRYEIPKFLSAARPQSTVNTNNSSVTFRFNMSNHWLMRKITAFLNERLRGSSTEYQKNPWRRQHMPQAVKLCKL
jgi:hypothetical protein